jgi:hypothetical protein
VFSVALAIEVMDALGRAENKEIPTATSIVACVEANVFVTRQRLS